jgi:sortase (surface protein transpeptidase)
MPFVAVHYGDLTSLIGALGNAVIAGHVLTLNEGNVFRFLYQLEVDDR